MIRRGRGGRKTLWADERGVSNVVAAVLTFALLVTVLGVVRVEFVPVWQAESEWDHMEEVQAEFKALKAEGERQIANHSSSSAVTTPVTLGSGSPLPVLTGGGQPGRLHFSPGAHPANLSADELMIFHQNGINFFGIDEDWTEVPSQTTIPDVIHVQHLRIRVNDPASLAGPPHGTEKGSVTLMIIDADGAFAGDIRVYVQSHSSGYNVNTRVRNADMSVLYDQGHSHFQHSTPEKYWVDALSPEVQFRGVLQSAKTPITLEWSEDKLTGEYTVSHLQETAGGGSLQMGGSGLLEPDWQRTHKSGMLTFESQHRHFQDQLLHYEHGALFLEQSDGILMLSPPPFGVSQAGNQTRISFTAAGLQGDHQSTGTSGSVLVALQATRHASITASAPNFVWEYPTAFPELWSSFWRDRLEKAGFDESEGHFTIQTGAAQARLEVFGLHADPSDHDIFLEIRQGSLIVGIDP